jgi:U3 small nucleolar RNA-associated protein 21
MTGTMASMTVEVDDGETTRPPRKKARSSLTGARTVTRPVVSEETPNSRRLFAPFRALGLITNQVPFALQVRAVKGSSEAPRLHILTCMGNSWALWEGEKMTLLFVGESTLSCFQSHGNSQSKASLAGSEAQDPITGLAFDGDFIWASSGPHLLKYVRGKEVSVLLSGLQCLPYSSPGRLAV